jgi:hypothetical protein
MREKGQVIFFDLMMAITVFLFLMLFLNSVWVDNANALVYQENLNELQFKSSQIAEMLVRSPGKPVNWHQPAQSPELIGLADKKNVLNPDKLNAFSTMDYNQLKDLMQVKNLEFFFQLTGPQDVNVGVSPPPDATVVAVRRIVNLNGSEAVVKFQLYRPE